MPVGDEINEAMVEGSTWTALPYAGTWADYGAGYRGGQYRKIGNVVQLRGLYKTVGAHAAGATVATLPVGFRPLATEYIVIGMYDAALVFNSLIINTNGTLITGVAIGAGGFMGPNLWFSIL